MFTAALKPEMFSKLNGQSKGSHDHLVALKKATPGTSLQWTTTWLRFLPYIFYARIEWKVYPRALFSHDQYSATAKAIHGFLDAAEDLQSPVTFAFKSGTSKPRKPDESEDLKFDMGKLLAALPLLQDKTMDDITFGIDRMVIMEDA
ncbi:hypothetical protein GGR52DRAFT_573920 [Hypoxylon sp. FL1284]|nr:hypothetical protein GGR52DRAFT_573920 [Hypoxylon sp. FL1284]